MGLDHRWPRVSLSKMAATIAVAAQFFNTAYEINILF